MAPTNTPAILAPHGVQLGAEKALDFFLLQWHTPVPEIGGRVPLGLAEKRRAFLSKFGEWLPAALSNDAVDRPCIILAPELSLPYSVRHEVAKLLAGLTRPVIFVAGFEFLSWAEYLELLADSPQEPELWSKNGGHHLFVNAAGIWIRERDGTTHQYLQAKRNLSNPEATKVFRCPELLYFRSKDQSNGSRLNFVVQVCADLTNQASVDSLRRRCEAAHSPAILELSLTVLNNADQQATELLQGLGAHFGPADQKASTRESLVVLLNNSRPTHARRQPYGNSKLAYEFSRNWRFPSPRPTYSVEEQGAHHHVSAVLRDGGPAVYWLTSKTPEFIEWGPSKGPSPFIRATRARIVDEEFVDAFCEVQPISFWLIAAWETGALALPKTLQDLIKDAGTRKALLDEYTSSVDDWRTCLAGSDQNAELATATYFMCCQGTGGSNEKPEPETWATEAEEGARRFQLALATLRSATPATPLKAQPSQVAHARLADDTLVSLVWGAGNLPPRSMMMQFLSRLEQRGARELLGSKLMLLLVGPMSASTTKQATASLNQLYTDQITESEEHAGDVTNATYDLKMTCVCDSRLMGVAETAASPVDLAARLLEELTIHDE